MARVHVKLQRVQQWLFSVPRLAAMIGANTLLGETLRVTLPDLARTPDRGWTLRRPNDALLTALTDVVDPIGTADEAARDDPIADARAGIHARDGGHFEADFTTSEGAVAFASAADAVIARDLPGLRCIVTVDKVPRSPPGRSLATEIPLLAVCEWTGHGLASALIVRDEDEALVSMNTVSRFDAAKRAEDGGARDLASFVTRSTVLARYKRPDDFKSLAGNGYLAVIHADGNGVGASAPKTGDEDTDAPLRARYFHRNRVLLRAALQRAVDAKVPDVSSRDERSPELTAPLVLLMVGGDDILVICRAALALPFVVTLCESLRALQENDKKEEFELTLGVGVAIARPSLPFHRLHAVAEQLAASAKRRYRGIDSKSPCSVVDWAVHTNAWAEDPGDVRRRDWVVGSPSERRILSRRPMPVLDGGASDTSGLAVPPPRTLQRDVAPRTLQGLLAGVTALGDAARSQLRYLVEQLSRGSNLADLAFMELAPDTNGALANAGVTRLWDAMEGASGHQITSLLDLVEVYEIARLGSSSPRPGDARASGAHIADGRVMMEKPEAVSHGA